MRFEIFKFESVTSTNDIAIDLIRKDKKKTGYAGNTNAEIFKYLFPYSITSGSFEKKLVITLADKKTKVPAVIIIIKAYLIAVKYVSLILTRLLAP